MRALVLDPAGQLFGSERVLLDFLDGARGSAWTISVCTTPGPLADRLRRRGIEVFDTFLPELHRRGRRHRALAALALLRCAARVRPHLIDVNQAGATRIALLVGRLLRVPVVSHVRIFEDVAYLESLRASARALPAIVCVSDSIRSRFSTLRARCHRVYDPYRPVEDDSAPRPFAERIELVCVGRVFPEKGQGLLVDAMARLRTDGVPARLRIVGPAPDPSFLDELRRSIAVHRLEAEVELVDFREDVFPLLRSAHILVCPSRQEPLGRVVFEAWDAGVVPIGYADAGGIGETLRASDGGVLFAKWDAESLAEAIRRTATLPPEQRAALVARGRAWMRAELAPEVGARRILSLWDIVRR
jgi:glycosyltransferase involved in cell wall biosynthesis